ncbi:META domain-containing protein [Novosphingobium guangzhouense]|uniref:DUF306 domain-containing protein n=1 Tax=Novosphingobium guangzhouense TaxID=1850347 RepID=A0A2K2FZ13_9SPHN|nr:META domain-containing protein [Novosphingobium guangzhouense]PNU04010.1 hypothetical protein A8V01_05170 [Novosphingobium guangzhouense]
MAVRLKLERMSGSLAVLLAIAGCASINEMAARESSLIGPTWQLQSIRQGDAVNNLSSEQAARYTIEFVAHDNARLRLDCNTGTAGWSASVMRRVLRIDEIRSTKMKCPDDRIAGVVLSGLPGGNTYGFTDDERTLIVQSGTATFTFRDAAH